MIYVLYANLIGRHELGERAITLKLGSSKEHSRSIKSARDPASNLVLAKDHSDGSVPSLTIGKVARS